ncbi:MAG: hypothetical protein FJW53_01320 [Actinobacteria bacterium]|nr:hypothetical protein [Actinomycetota bacterium]
MVRYLSSEWIDAVGAAVASTRSIHDLAETHDIGVTQVVTGGPAGDVTYHLRVGQGSVHFGAGEAPREDVRLSQSWDTAVGVATSTLPAQEALVRGLVKITGDPTRLVDAAPVFAALDHAFEKVRTSTIYE